MKCRTGPCGTKTRPATPNRHVISTMLFPDIPQRTLVINDRRSGTTY